MSSESKYLNDQYKSFFEDSLSKTDPDLYKAINDGTINANNFDKCMGHCNKIINEEKEGDK